MSLFGRRGAAAERRGTPADLLVVGLGNPGGEYAGTAATTSAPTSVELLAERHGGALEAVAGAGAGGRGPHRRPAGGAGLPPDVHEPVGRVGRPAGPSARHHRPRAASSIVHDELDLPLGRVKVKQGGGLAGHNGLRSIKAHLHTDDFLRVRIGVGKPPSKEQGADHVLRRVSKRERVELDIAVQEAADAVEADPGGRRRCRHEPVQHPGHPGLTRLRSRPSRGRRPRGAHGLPPAVRRATTGAG